MTIKTCGKGQNGSFPRWGLKGSLCVLSSVSDCLPCWVGHSAVPRGTCSAFSLRKFCHLCLAHFTGLLGRSDSTNERAPCLKAPCSWQPWRWGRRDSVWSVGAWVLESHWSQPKFFPPWGLTPPVWNGDNLAGYHEVTWHKKCVELQLNKLLLFFLDLSLPCIW